MSTPPPPFQITHIPVPTELPVFLCDLSSVPDRLELAKQALAELQVSHPDSPPSNVQARYMSPWKSHTLNPKLLPLCSVVTYLATEIARKYMGASTDALNMELVVTDCWGVIYEDSDHVKPHSHFPAEFACVVYLDAASGCAPIVFGNGLLVQPQPNSVVIFPGVLTHQVPANSGLRSVIAMNLAKRATFQPVNT